MQGGHIVVLNGGQKEVAYEEGTRLWQLAEQAGIKDVVCALMNGRIVSLADEPEPGAEVRFLSPRDSEEASRVFLRGATFLLYRAARELFPERTLIVEHMLCGGLYCEMTDLQPGDAALLQRRMDELIAADEDFVLFKLPVEKARKIMLEEGLASKAALLEYRPFSFYRLYAFGPYHNYFHGIMPKSSGYLKGARVHPYDDGLILTYPTPYIEACTPIIHQPKYGRVFRQAEKWASILGVSYVADLNNLLRNGGIEEFINVNEALHERTIAEIAQTIASQPRVRIVLVAGPSSSGKTTFASRLAVHLKVLGKRCQPISVDDYYRDREDIPRMPDGKPDFECIEALDTEKLSEDLNLLLSGEEARIPRFDFIEGRRCGLVPLRIRDDILIIEGIHGLNNALTAGVDDAYKFRIFISPLTTLNIDSHSVVIPEDMRLLRRLVRDKRTRGYSFAQTLAIWNSVRRGEYKYILPYQENADVMFNSTLLYEGLILKKYAYSELKSITPDMENYPEALGLLKFLNYFLTLDDDSLVPRQSILREFIGR
ncbi:MAG: nucleoside kinase [Christensenellaceae bacterium]|nr:nucleoside kinase [Christensenellaceae bacterium]